jgi:hypothetical protein
MIAMWITQREIGGATGARVQGRVLGAKEEIEPRMKSSQGRGKSVMSHLPKESDKVNLQRELRSHRCHMSDVQEGGRFRVHL